MFLQLLITYILPQKWDLKNHAFSCCGMFSVIIKVEIYFLTLKVGPNLVLISLTSYKNSSTVLYVLWFIKKCAFTDQCSLAWRLNAKDNVWWLPYPYLLTNHFAFFQRLCITLFKEEKEECSGCGVNAATSKVRLIVNASISFQ